MRINQFSALICALSLLPACTLMYPEEPIPDELIAGVEGGEGGIGGEGGEGGEGGVGGVGGEGGMGGMGGMGGIEPPPLLTQVDEANNDCEELPSIESPEIGAVFGAQPDDVVTNYSARGALDIEPERMTNDINGLVGSVESGELSTKTSLIRNRILDLLNNGLVVTSNSDGTVTVDSTKLILPIYTTSDACNVDQSNGLEAPIMSPGLCILETLYANGGDIGSNSNIRNKYYTISSLRANINGAFEVNIFTSYLILSGTGSRGRLETDIDNLNIKESFIETDSTIVVPAGKHVTISNSTIYMTGNPKEIFDIQGGAVELKNVLLISNGKSVVINGGTFEATELYSFFSGQVDTAPEPPVQIEMLSSNDATEPTAMLVDIKGWFIEQKNVNAIRQADGTLDVAYVITEGLNHFWEGQHPSDQNTPSSFVYTIKNANIKAKSAIILTGEGNENIGDNDFRDEYCARPESEFESRNSPFTNPGFENIHLTPWNATPDALLEPMIQVTNATLKVRGLSIEQGDMLINEDAELIASELNLMDSALHVSAGTQVALYKAKLSRADRALIINDGGDVRIRSASLSAPTFFVSTPRSSGAYTSTLCDIIFDQAIFDQTGPGVAFNLSDGHAVTAHNTSVTLNGGRLAELTSGGHLMLSKSSVASTETPTGLGRMLRAHKGGALSMSDVTVDAGGFYPRLMIIDDSSLLALEKTKLIGIDQSGLVFVPTDIEDADVLMEGSKTLDGVHLEHQTTDDPNESELRAAILIAPDATSVVSGPMSSDDVERQPVTTNGRLVVGLPFGADGGINAQLDALSELFTCHDGIYALDCSVDPSALLCPRPMED